MKKGFIILSIITYCLLCITLTSAKDEDEFYELGKKRYLIGDLPGAKQYLKEVLDLNPRHKRSKSLIEIIEEEEKTKEEGGYIDLSLYLKKAVLYDHRIKIAEKRIDYEWSSGREIRANAWPSIWAELSYETGSKEPWYRVYPYKWNAFLVGHWDLITFGKRKIRIKRAKLQEFLAFLEATRVKQEVILDAVRIYCDVLEKQEEKKEAENLVKITSDHLQKVRFFHKTGGCPRITLLNAEDRFFEAKDDLMHAESELTVAKKRLNKIVGEDVEVAYTTIKLPEEVVERYLDLAYKNLVEVKKIDNRIEEAKLSYKLAQRERYPTLTLDAKYGYTDDNLFPGKKAYWFLAMFRIPIFDGGLTRARIMQQERLQEVSELERDELKDRIKMEVEEAYLRCEDALERLIVNRGRVDRAKEILDITKERYDLEFETQRDVIFAIDRLLWTKKRYLDSVKDYWINKIKFALMLGIDLTK
ncbi:MAG: TolC family protein [bacterium]|nr:TolC family protein [bacterium]